MNFMTGFEGIGRCRQWQAVVVNTESERIITGALHVHEEGVGALHEPLQLVLPGLSDWGGVQQILNELQDSERTINQLNFTFFHDYTIEQKSFFAANESAGIEEKREAESSSRIIPPCLLFFGWIDEMEGREEREKKEEKKRRGNFPCFFVVPKREQVSKSNKTTKHKNTLLLFSDSKSQLNREAASQPWSPLTSSCHR